MVHACACCPLRFRTPAELADHVRAEHTEHEPFEEGQLSVQVYRRPRPADVAVDQILGPRR